MLAPPIKVGGVDDCRELCHLFADGYHESCILGRSLLVHLKSDLAG
jgi:hypothetical protein